MKSDHKFTCQILLLHRNEGRNGLHFGHFEGHKNALSYIMLIFHAFHLCDIRLGSILHLPKKVAEPFNCISIFI
jgi:hypothetical protein